MHPEFLREMTDQRTREMRARAHQARLARLARVVSRRGRHVGAAVDEADGFVKASSVLFAPAQDCQVRTRLKEP